MKDLKQKIKIITSKNEEEAVCVLSDMLDNSDVALFEELVKQSDFIFPFIKDNICRRFEKSLKASNYKNLFNFMHIYSPDYDRVFATALKVFGNDEIKPYMLNLLKNGSISEKTYASVFYEISPDLFAIKELISNSFSQNEDLAAASAAALGTINEQKSYELALEKLKSNDDFVVLQALNFFVNYIKNPPMKEIFDAFQNFSMPENFAGKIAFLKPLPVLIKEDLEHALPVIDHILIGLGEILPLADLFNFELYDVIGILSESSDSDFLPQIATILLRAKFKFQIISNNDEYTFDEDKNTKNEIAEIQNLLNSFGENYWLYLQSLVPLELSQNYKRISSALDVIRDFKINNAISSVIDMIFETEDQTLICDGISTLKKLNALSLVNKEDIFPLLQNENIKALVESCFISE
jgi:hypothetical protein